MYIIVYIAVGVASTEVLRVGMPLAVTQLSPSHLMAPGWAWVLGGGQTQGMLTPLCNHWAYCVSHRPGSCQVTLSGCSLASVRSTSRNRALWLRLISPLA